MRRRIVAMVLAVWALTAAAAAAAVDVTGVVKDPSGGVVADATVIVLTAEQTAVATAQTDAQGRFTLQVPSAGRYLLVAKKAALGESRMPLTVGAEAASSVEVDAAGQCPARRRHRHGLPECR